MLFDGKRKEGLLAVPSKILWSPKKGKAGNVTLSDIGELFNFLSNKADDEFLTQLFESLSLGKEELYKSVYRSLVKYFIFPLKLNIKSLMNKVLDENENVLPSEPWFWRESLPSWSFMKVPQTRDPDSARVIYSSAQLFVFDVELEVFNEYF